MGEDFINKFKRDAFPELVNVDEADTLTDRIYNQIMADEVSGEAMSINPNTIRQREDQFLPLENTLEDQTHSLFTLSSNTVSN